MKSFSEISDNLGTSRDRFVEEFSVKSGLDKQLVSKLYENAKFECNGDSKKIEEKFKSLLEININTFESKIQEFIAALQAAGEDINRQDFILRFLDNCSKDTDEYNFYKVLLYTLFLKDQVNFNKLATCLDTNKTLNESFGVVKQVTLFESVGINPEYVKEGRVPLIVGVNDGQEIKDDIRFYSGLKELLARNNKRWGASYHLDNAYRAILDYLDQEITELINKDNITTVDSHFEETIINELFRGELNPMYRNIDILRPLIVDIQTLTFDMMCLVMCFVNANSKYCRYLNRKEFDEFLEAFYALYSQISSSHKTSYILLKENKEDQNTDGPIHAINVKGPDAIFQKIYVDYEKFNLNLQPIKTVAAVDALYIMKACTSEFNLKIRKYINHFVTKGFNIIGRLEKVMTEAMKFNRNKNSDLW